MVNEVQKKIINSLSKDMPLSPEPYKAIAMELKITEEELLDNLQQLHQKGILRRVGAVLYHREAGYKGNAMVVWKVPEERVDEVGKIASTFNEITHCYERTTGERWRYNFFTMVHSCNLQQCEVEINKISKAIGIYDYKVLHSIKELKKSSMNYF
ncbi:Lrp/AsnC family transcriptional regulator [Clostridium sp. CX1]|uniref:siroheme decarboxylase n=1 Tax=Clostridium tanneri TaxID=3037988 RepID=A0ABU4JTZ7_9CLOT|nr:MULTISPECIES: Lrp/AsnC family transcriptional regulator [unclassified Clostridium]MCT8975386.1 Lrp/AsnC family transcriptional regulator [Clostridium sp. CX1]MDW8801383.1 Lrp/AsnC family transcriptional regulator [Clostridium sp. A1-XYC3]